MTLNDVGTNLRQLCRRCTSDCEASASSSSSSSRPMRTRPGPARSRTHYIRFNSHMPVATTAQAGRRAARSDVVRSHHEAQQQVPRSALHNGVTASFASDRRHRRPSVPALLPSTRRTFSSHSVLYVFIFFIYFFARCTVFLRINLGLRYSISPEVIPPYVCIRTADRQRTGGGR